MHLPYLVNVFCDEHTLTPPRPGDKFVLHTNASMKGIGAVLPIEREDIEFQCHTSPKDWCLLKGTIVPLKWSAWQW